MTRLHGTDLWPYIIIRFVCSCPRGSSNVELPPLPFSFFYFLLSYDIKCTIVHDTFFNFDPLSYSLQTLFPKTLSLPF